MPNKLAKFRRTQLGSQFKSQKKNIEAPQTGRVTSQLNALAGIKGRKESREESMFLENLKLGLNQGKMNEVTYYNELANHFENKLSQTHNKLEQVKLQNRIYTYRDAAVDAASAAAGRARSTAAKAVNAKYRDMKAHIKDIKTDIFVIKLPNGGYENSGKFIDEMNTLYEAETKMLKYVADNDLFTESSRESALTRLDEMDEQFKNPRGEGDYGGLNYKLDNKDDFIFTQSTTGQFPGGIDVTFKSSLGTGWVEGEDNILRKTRFVGEIDQQTGDLVVKEPTTGEEKIYKEGTAEFFALKGRRAVDIYDPLDPNDQVIWLAPLKEGGQWDGVGKYAGIKVDKPTFNPRSVLDVNIATTPWIPGTPAYADLQKRGAAAIINDRVKSRKAVLEPKEIDIFDTQFKKPELRKEERSDGSFAFFEGDKKVSAKDYAKKTGTIEAALLAEEGELTPMKKLGAAQEESGKGFNHFKNLYNRYFKK